MNTESPCSEGLSPPPTPPGFPPAVNLPTCDFGGYPKIHTPWWDTHFRIAPATEVYIPPSKRIRQYSLSVYPLVDAIFIFCILPVELRIYRI